jgi:hypothetical protein
MEGDFREYYINDLYTTHAVVCWVTAVKLGILSGVRTTSLATEEQPMIHMVPQITIHLQPPQREDRVTPFHAGT